MKVHSQKSKSKSKHYSEASSPLMSVEVIEPGVIILRNYLSETEQRRMAEGTIQSSEINFSNWSASHAFSATSIARKIDPSVPRMNEKNMKLNMYAILPSGHISQRKLIEIDDNTNYPVVNICTGASCRFKVSLNDGVMRDVILNSGDVLVYTGNKNGMRHSLVEVFPDDIPHWMSIQNGHVFSHTNRYENEKNLESYYNGFERYTPKTPLTKNKNKNRRMAHAFHA